MELWTSLIDACGSALVAGLFGVVMWYLQKQEKQGKVRDEDTKKRLETIQANTAKLADHDALIVSLSEIASQLKEATDQNSEGVKVLMRYMLQRYHATYMMRGFINSHEKQEFLEAYAVYHSKGGNGTGESWKREVDTLPVRDDVPVINPYLEMLKENKGE
ncbi:hypothetical protein [Faecalibaculum rodentium]|uniref:hypothetical protein n=1 Tax=Faecalibaculum rodentium TaxID=1702221 RepID=UPI0025B78FC5|nr:hypothetical protein [Faecalibaculum rodentium]